MSNCYNGYMVNNNNMIHNDLLILVGHMRVRRDDSAVLTPEFVRAPAAVFNPAEYLRDRRDTGYAPAPVSYSAPVTHVKGRVGPVYTFVKTDPQVSLSCLLSVSSEKKTAKIYSLTENTFILFS